MEFSNAFEPQVSAAMNGPEPEYDVFVSHSDADRRWVQEWLVPRLQKDGISVATPSTPDVYVIGKPELQNIEYAFQVAHRVIFVLTPEWLAQEVSDFESEVLRIQDPAARRRKLLPLMLKPCDPNSLPAAIRTLKLNIADFREEERRAGELRRLVGAIERSVPPPTTPLRDRSKLAWRRWLVWHRRLIAWAALGAVVLTLLALMALQVPPFEPRLGWRALGLNDRGAWRLFRASDVLLAATDTNAGCRGQDTGLRRSSDHGASWQRVVIPELDFGGPGQCNRAAIRDLAATSVPSQRLYAATTNVGLIASDDLGNEWEEVGETSLPLRELFAVAALPGTPLRLFVTGDQSGLYRSLDAGATWQRVDGEESCRDPASGSGLPLAAARRALLLATETTLYIAPYYDSSPAGLPPESGLYASDDGGECWRLIFASDLKYNFAALAASPTVADEIFFVAVDRNTDFEQTLWRFNPREQTQALWNTRVFVAALYLAEDGNAWYAANHAGEVWRGSTRNDTDAQQLGRGPFICGWMPCYTDLAPGGELGPPLLLTDGRAFEWGEVSWHKWLFP
jgi:photosystem II stability/assembly factor-like uncharacterized protein